MARQETLLAVTHIQEKHAGSGNAGIWQYHNNFLFHKVVLSFPESMQESCSYHPSTEALKSYFWVATFSSEIITKSDFSTLGSSVAEKLSPAAFVLLNSSVGPHFHHSEQPPVISNVHPFTVFPPLFQITYDHTEGIHLIAALCGSPAPALLPPHCRGQLLTLCFLPCKWTMQTLFPNYGSVYSMTE